MTKWEMFWQGHDEAKKMELDKWENWTPLLYYFTVSYGIFFLILGFIFGICEGILLMLLITNIV